MKAILLPRAVGVLLLLCVAIPVHALRADPVCVQTPPLDVLGHQVLPGVYQCLPPI